MLWTFFMEYFSGEPSWHLMHCDLSAVIGDCNAQGAKESPNPAGGGKGSGDSSWTRNSPAVMKYKQLWPGEDGDRPFQACAHAMGMSGPAMANQCMWGNRKREGPRLKLRPGHREGEVQPSTEEALEESSVSWIEMTAPKHGIQTHPLRRNEPVSFPPLLLSTRPHPSLLHTTFFVKSGQSLAWRWSFSSSWSHQCYLLKGPAG